MALERFIPKSPDIFIRNSQDFEVAKFGHLNTIVEYINNNSAKPAGLNGYVQFNDNSALGGDAGLFWDNVNKRLGIGTVTPVNLLSIDATNSTLPTEHSAAAATIKSGVQSPLRVLRTGGQPNVWIGTSSTTPNVSSFLFGIRTGAYYNTATPTYSGDYAPWIVSRGNDWGTATSASDLRMSQIFTCDGNTARAALAIYPALVETATNTDIVNMNNLLIATRNSFSTQPLARLQIIGDGQTSGTTSLLVQNSTGTTSLRVYDDRVVEVPYRIHTPFIRNEYANLVLYSGSYEVEIQSSNPTNGSGSLRTTGEITTTDSQTKSIININNLVPSTSASFNTLNGFAFTSTITQTTGTIRGLFINPTLNASTDFRAIETVRGNVLFATTSGNVGIGTSSPIYKADIAGSLRVTDGSFSLTYTGNVSNGSLINAGTYPSFKLTNAAGDGRVSLNNEGPNGSLSLQANGTTYTYLTGTATGNAGYSYFLSQLGVGTATTLGAKLSIKGSGSTSATTSLLVQNSLGSTALQIQDDGNVNLGNATDFGVLSVPRSSTFGERVFLKMQSGGNLLATSSNDGLVVKSYLVVNGILYVDSGTIYGKTTGGATNTNAYTLPSQLIPTFSANSCIINLNGGGRLQGSSDGQYIRIEGNMTLDSSGNELKGFYFNPTLIGAFSPQNVLAIHSTYGGAYLNTATPQASAVLQADSTTQGFLPPRMTTAQRVAIASPANGLIVFDTDVQNLCYRRDGVWVQATFAAV
jgi:hypothetical protein